MTTGPLLLSSPEEDTLIDALRGCRHRTELKALEQRLANSTDAPPLFHRLEEKRRRRAFIRPDQSTIGKHRRQLIGEDAAGDLDGTWCHDGTNSNTVRNNGVRPQSPIPCKDAKYPTIRT